MRERHQCVCMHQVSESVRPAGVQVGYELRQLFRDSTGSDWCYGAPAGGLKNRSDACGFSKFAAVPFQVTRQQHLHGATDRCWGRGQRCLVSCNGRSVAVGIPHHQVAVIDSWRVVHHTVPNVDVLALYWKWSAGRMYVGIVLVQKALRVERFSFLLEHGVRPAGLLAARQALDSYQVPDPRLARRCERCIEVARSCSVPLSCRGCVHVLACICSLFL